MEPNTNMYQVSMYNCFFSGCKDIHNVHSTNVSFYKLSNIKDVIIDLLDDTIRVFSSKYVPLFAFVPQEKTPEANAKTVMYFIKKEYSQHLLYKQKEPVSEKHKKISKDLVNFLLERKEESLNQIH